MGSNFILVIALLASTSLASTWNYNNPNVDWPGVNVACTNTATAKQSPIDIVRWSASINTSDLTLKADYTSRSSLYLKNAGGHTQKVIAVTTEEFGTIVYNNKTYKFLQFHFHQPSEHTISGNRFDMELHMVHQIDTGASEFLVLGYLFNIGGSDNEWLNNIGYKTGSVTTDAKVKISKSVDPWAMAKQMNHMEAYAYEGSFTTPPCTEGVHWFVFREWNYLSKAQWNAYKASQPAVAMVYSTATGSYRPTQPINSRVVTLRTLHIDNGGWLSAGTIAGIVIACVLALALLIAVPAICWWCARNKKREDDAKAVAEHIEREADGVPQPYQEVAKN